MKKIILFCCLAALISCQKEGSEYTGDSDSKVLVAIKQNDQMFVEFIYDSLNRLIRSDNYVNDSVLYSETYQYDAKSRMSQRIYSGFTETYEYDRSGDLISVRLVYLAAEEEWKTEYQYSRNRISKGITYYDGNKRGYVDFKYDSNGNTIERSEYTTTEGQADFLDSQFRMTFDDKRGPLKNPYIYPADITMKNNPVYYYHYLAMMSSPPKEYHSRYDYDYEGYPIREYRGSRVLTYHYRVLDPL